MKTAFWIKGLYLAAAAAAYVATASAQTITVFAAASLQGPLDEIAKAWPGTATISYGGSGSVARQVSLGAPADVVFLASAEWMSWLSEGGFLHGTPQDVVSNRLVLIGPRGAEPLPTPDAKTLAERLNGDRLAMGHHRAVPAGTYAAAWLQGIGAWEAIQPQLAETENVRAALLLVERGEAPLGIVYASDAQASGKVGILYSVPSDAHPPIQYPIAAVTAEGQVFVDYLVQARSRFDAYGFVATP